MKYCFHGDHFSYLPTEPEIFFIFTKILEGLHALEILDTSLLLG